jgi:hypothetical protein
MKITLTADRVTKGAVRFVENKEDWPINIYLRKEQVSELGLEAAEGQKVSVTIVKVK